MPSRVPSRFAACAIAVGALLAVAGPAVADHGAVGAPAPQRGSAGTTGPRTALGLSLTTTAFEIDGFSGTFHTAAAHGEYWRGRFGARMRVPVHTLSMDGDPDRHTGLGDVAPGLAWMALRTDTAVIDVGLDAYLPTGDSSAGMGAGALALAPGARATFALPAGLAVDADAAAIINVSGGEPTTFIEQRADAELRAGTALTWPWGRARLSGHAFVVVPLAPADARGDVFVNAGPTLTLRLPRSWWLAASVDVPLRDARAYDLRAGLTVGYTWTGDRRTSACRTCAAP